jgi:hypothetical protein
MCVLEESPCNRHKERVGITRERGNARGTVENGSFRYLGGVRKVKRLLMLPLKMGTITLSTASSKATGCRGGKSGGATHQRHQHGACGSTRGEEGRQQGKEKLTATAKNGDCRSLCY